MWDNRETGSDFSVWLRVGFKMRGSFHSIFKKAKMSHLIEVKRRFKDVGSTTGFIVDFSEPLVLFHTLDTDAFLLNGYTMIRREDITETRVFSKAEYWQVRAVRHFDLKPMRPAGISVASLPALLKSVANNYPLITLHPEQTKPDICFIGQLVSMTERTFTIEDLDSNGEWRGPRRMKFSDVTRVDFGDGYAGALAATAPKRAKD